MPKLTDINDDKEILDLVQGIRRAPGQAGDYAPHKPFMLLIALARIQQGADQMMHFDEVAPILKTLLTEFAKTNSVNTSHLPFWRLKNDQEGRIWELKTEQASRQIEGVSPPAKKVLLESDIQGGFTDGVFYRLKSSPLLLAQVAQTILDSTFPSTIHQDICDVIGLDLRPTHVNPGMAKRSRDPAFREQVLRAYEFRCCVCGFDLRVVHMPAGLEAAHIQWHTAGGPDVVPNGLSLCALHHKLFDLGAFTVEPGEYRVIFSQHAIASSRNNQGELRHHGQSILKPQAEDMRPGRVYLDWNRRTIFKLPGRPSEKS